MAYTHSDIRVKVGQRVRDTGYSTSEITQYLNDTLNDIYNEYRLPFMQTTQTYTVTTGVADITNGSGLPDDFSQTINLVNTTSGAEAVIPYKELVASDDEDPDQDDNTVHATGAPEYWYFADDTIKLFPEPAAAYTLLLRYYKNPTLLSADADIPDLPSQYEEALVMGASYRILQVKDNYDQAAILQNKFDEILDKLVLRSSQRQVGTPTVMRINRRHVGKVSF